ncbi:MAG: class I SAM-dependent methyltransferase [Phycisphaerales bacterium]
MIGFFANAIRSYRTTGAIAPSSQKLAAAMTKSIAEDKRACRRILEVGPGTGAFTGAVLPHLRAGDVFDIVEINPVFAAALEADTLAGFRAVNPDVALTLHTSAVEDAKLAGEYHHIICGLPFNNFPVSMVSLIFRRLMSLLQVDGDLVYFEYICMKAPKLMWIDPRVRRRTRRRVALSRALDRRYAGVHDRVMWNLPPAHAIRLHR